MTVHLIKWPGFLEKLYLALCVILEFSDYLVEEKYGFRHYIDSLHPSLLFVFPFFFNYGHMLLQRAYTVRKTYIYGIKQISTCNKIPGNHLYTVIVINRLQYGNWEQTFAHFVLKRDILTAFCPFRTSLRYLHLGKYLILIPFCWVNWLKRCYMS